MNKLENGLTVFDVYFACVLNESREGFCLPLNLIDDDDNVLQRLGQSRAASK